MFSRFKLAAAIVLSACIPVAVSAQSHRELAPADEYFGRMRISVLGIANMLRDAGTRINANSGSIEHEFDGTLSFATDAIHDWEAKYPRDPWIARSLLAMSHVYLGSNCERGMHLANATVEWLVHDYPGSPAARAAERDLADYNHR